MGGLLCRSLVCHSVVCHAGARQAVRVTRCGSPGARSVHAVRPWRSGPDEDFESCAISHGLIPGSDVLERERQIEDFSGLDGALKDVGE